MMKTLLSITGLFLLSIFFNHVLFAQSSQTEIRWAQLSERPNIDQTCFEIEVKKTQPFSDSYLGTQNYRFYYDASQLRFNRDHSKSLLGVSSYSDLSIKQDIFNSNAAGFGTLEFDDHLGFVNIAIVDSGQPDKLVSLDTEVWQSTARICFEHVSTGAAQANLIWARQGLTEGYATAFTEVEQVTENASLSSEIIYHDLQSEINLEAIEKMVINKY